MKENFLGSLEQPSKWAVKPRRLATQSLPGDRPFVGHIHHGRQFISILGLKATGSKFNIAYHIGISKGEALLLPGAHQIRAVYLKVVDIDQILVVAAATYGVVRTQLVRFIESQGPAYEIGLYTSACIGEQDISGLENDHLISVMAGLSTTYHRAQSINGRLDLKGQDRLSPFFSCITLLFEVLVLKGISDRDFFTRRHLHFVVSFTVSERGVLLVLLDYDDGGIL